jgi:salicylate 5-hydroxylase small subunit
LAQSDGPVTVDLQLRQAIADLYAAYAACLDDGRHDEWPNFFTEDAWYRVVPRENYERGLPLSTMSLKGRAMMKDRIYGVVSTIFHAPYYQRHVIGLPVVVENNDDQFSVQANYCVFRTKRDSMPEIFNIGQYVDIIINTDGVLKFSQKFCVFDNDLIPNSLIYPI